MKECKICGSKDIYTTKNGVALCLNCANKKYGVQRPDYGRRIIYVKKGG